MVLYMRQNHVLDAMKLYEITGLSGHLQVIVVCGSHADKDCSVCRPDVLDGEPMQWRVLRDLVGDDQTRRQRRVIHHLAPLALHNAISSSAHDGCMQWCTKRVSTLMVGVHVS